ncbi:alpha/beta hydrolase [Vibrio pelagius]|uniref:Alpha/beta hydrolase n=1 Tax=Vibrio pelagius TaxID=28169 RepID=A0ABY5G3V8_VIBPE|nr:alpha/beta hydrolase [Vibrio pelagius]UTT84846.1 alpha/beta hydrolase [Vibrio pelagius]
MKPEVPLLWLPGLLCDEALFHEVNSELPNWVAPFTSDLAAETSMQALASKVLKDAPDTFILGGLSMGGILAFEVLRQAPTRVKGLILMDTNSADEKPEVSEKRYALVDKAKAGEFESITPNVLMPVLIHPNQSHNQQLTEQISQMAINVGVSRFEAHAHALATRPDSRPLLADIKIPTLVITGRDDLLCPIDNHLLMAKHIENVSLHVIPDCGHLSTMEQPQRVAAHINHWLDVHQALLVK